MLKVEPIPAFQDNYIWAIHDGKSAAVVDPGEAEPVERFLAQRGLALGAIVITHHHGDHIWGLPFFPKMEIVSHKYCREAMLAMDVPAGATWEKREIGRAHV